MRKLILALVLTTVVCLVFAAVAAADPGAIQVSGQSATTAQQAEAASGATQVDPTNTDISIRVLSPGDDGDVSQSNTVGSSATAGNQAATTQTAGQVSGGSGIQTSQQQAGTDQLALALSEAAQIDPTNANLPVRVLSPGSDGSVTQSNTAGSQATSGNAATTGQSSSQNQGGASCGCSGSGSGVQSANQSAGTQQGAGAISTATQDHPSNTNVSIRVLSPGSDGSVTQSNTVGSSATSGNAATTTQNATQTQAGSGCGCETPWQETTPVQQASPAAGAASPAADGGVNQANTDGSSANAGNLGTTGQDAQQNTSGTAIQTGDQSAGTDQSAVALSGAKQIDPSNTAGPTRVLSPGGDGSVSQANTVGSTATSGNSASTTQSSTQSQGGSCGCSEPIRSDAVPSSASAPAIQVAGQDAATKQGSLAGSDAVQIGASNNASPVRVKSPGGGGDVSQSNTAGSSATAGNASTTKQKVDQAAAGRSCGCGNAIQVVGQKAGTGQGSLALSGAFQGFGPGKSECGCGGGGSSGNDASPVRVGSPGSDGDVTQSNTVGSSATSGNSAATEQNATQDAAGRAIQVLGQKAETGQLSFAGSLAAQFGAANKAAPVRVKSPGGGGSVSQQNSAGSQAASGNASDTRQQGSQDAGSSRCGCSSTPIQVLGQRADTSQLAKALSAAFQHALSNDSSPVRVWSRGDGGRTTQGNTGSSLGTSGNRATTDGEATQLS